MAIIQCSECGKEISSKANFCVHCGAPVTNNENDIQNKKLKFFYSGDWFLIDVSVEVYLNDNLILKSSIKKGFEFEIANNTLAPKLLLKIPFKSKIIKLPHLYGDKNYLIEIEYDRVWGNFSEKPKSITTF